MKPDLRLAAAVLLATLAGCYYPPLNAEWTENEAPKQLTVDRATSQFGLRFAAGSDRLLPADAAQLRHLAATGQIAPRDHVAISVGGAAPLATARYDRIAAELAAYRIVADRGSLAGVPANQAIIDTGRYLVTLPPCPNWSKPAAMHFTNTYPSNYGCATTVNLGLMVWHPGDLVEGVPHEVSYTPGLNDATGTVHPLIVPPGTTQGVVPVANNPAYFTNGDISDALRVLPPPPPPAGATPSTAATGAASFVVPTAPATPGTGGH